jgi:Asp-tRNA(Asn)/Glu-tRNA(Gln) amidotransferase A subunit family amidase
VLGIPAAEYVQKAGVQAYGAFEAVIGYLRTNGFATVETSALSNIEAIASTHRRLIAAEFARVHAGWYSQYSDRYRPRTASLFAEGAALGYTAVLEGQRSADELARTLEDMMEIEGITTWVSPSATGVAPLGLDYIGDPIMGLPWTHAHLPVVSLPIPHLGTLPLGIQFTGRAGQDEELLDLAHRVEQAMQQDLRAKPPRT